MIVLADRITVRKVTNRTICFWGITRSQLLNDIHLPKLAKASCWQSGRILPFNVQALNGAGPYVPNPYLERVGCIPEEFDSVLVQKFSISFIRLT